MREATEPSEADEQAVPGRVVCPLLLACLYGLVAVPALRGDAMPPVIACISALLAAALIALSVIDLRSYRLPDGLTVALIVTGWSSAVWLGGETLAWRAAASLAGYLMLYAVAVVYQLLRGRDGLGLGDAKLLAGAAAWLGLEGLPAVMLWATSLAILTVLSAALLGRRIKARSAIPFGPFLALGFWLVWLYGPLA